ncbi:hypothetical protein QEN19_003080 [Hanseniaspora menglaensis]
MDNHSLEVDIYSFYCFYILSCNLYNSLLANKSGNSFGSNIDKNLSLNEISTKFPFSNQEKCLWASKSPIFVTWLKFSDSESLKDNYELRGCIGTFSKLDLNLGLKEYALIAALKDNRFPPIGFEELKDLKCGVSILHNFKVIYDKSMTDTRMHDADSKRDNSNFWVHIEKNFQILPNNINDTNGIEIKFSYYNSHFSSTFLPEVMVENEFDIKDTVEHLFIKGLSHEYSSSKDQKAITKVLMYDPRKYIDKVTVYKSSKTSITYSAFKKVVSSWAETE